MVAIKESTSHVELDSSLEEKDEAAALLEKARALLKRRLSFFVWQGFFEPLKALTFKDRALTLEAPTSFHRNWVCDHYMNELLSAVSESFGENTSVEILCSTDAQHLKLSPREKNKEKSKKPLKEKSPIEADLPELEHKGKAPVLPIFTAPPSSNDEGPRLSLSNLNAGYTFEAFVQGPSNQMAYAAAMSVADHPGRQFSPLFLFGGVGLGKTHLLHAIGLRAKERDPSLKVVLLSAEQWVNSYIQAIRERRFDSFRNRYRNSCDILLIDDIQFLAGKDASQDEFFHTFNSLHEAKKQIVVTSDKYPHEISGLEERLQTRLAWGLIADIRPPEIETRIAILQKKAEGLCLNFSDDIINFLAASVTTSVRELEGALVRLQACANFGNKEISLNQAKDMLAPMIKKKTVTVSPQKVCEVVASHYSLRASELSSKNRQRQVAFARQIAMNLCRSMLKMSLPEIGKAFGGRDHSTVFSSLRKIEEEKAKDISLQALIERLEQKIASLPA
jgi:chromosomal replication initiator protein